MTRRPKHLRCLSLAALFTLQLAAITGLLFSLRTMQPYRTAASEAAQLSGNGIVLLPRGNDGTAIPGAFAIESPLALPLLLIAPNDPLPERLAPYHRVVLALLPRDSDSTAAITAQRATLASPNWRRVAIGSNVEVFERSNSGE